MNRVGEFEKVSYDEFYKAMREIFGCEYRDEFIQMAYDTITLPKRATSGSAGYDFVSPISFELSPSQSIKIPTGIRVKIDDGWWLGCLPRSSLGFKYRLQLDNTMGVIDGDYYNSDNEGHIFAKLTNCSEEYKVVSVEAGNSFMQAVFIPYGVTYSDDVDKARNGGIGSTGK